MKKIIFILFLSSFALNVFAQTDSNRSTVTDTIEKIRPSVAPKPTKRRLPADSLRRRKVAGSLPAKDTLPIRDSIALVLRETAARPILDSIKLPVKLAKKNKPVDSFYLKLLDNPFLRSKSKPIFLVINERKRTSKDEMFYLVVGLLFFLAFIKLVFSKYFQNLFRLFFQPSFRQKQTREQLQQGNLPSLLLNLFFVLSAGAYVSFVLQYYQVVTISFWLLMLYSCIALVLLYAGKFIFLSFAGWVFNVKEATEAYIFAIYLINKVIGVVLIPFTLVIAFSQSNIKNISITISILLILVLFLYRYLVSFAPVRRDVKVSVLHFFFYVLAFEITPLLLIYKTLMLYLNKSL